VIEQPAAFTESGALSRESQLIEQTKSPDTLRLSVNHLLTPAWELDDELVAYYRERFRAVGLWRPKLSHFGEERLAELLSELGMSVSSLSWAGGFTGTNRWSYVDSIRDARNAIKAAATVGAECLCMVSGPRGGHIAKHARRLITHAVKELAPEAAEAGVTLALQPMRTDFSRKWTFLHTLDETLEILSHGRGAVKLAFDVYHLWQEPRVLARIPEIASQIATVQLCDSHNDPRGERRLMGDGEIPLGAIVQAFDEAGFTGYYELAPWSKQLWQRDYSELLRECRVRFDALCRRPVPASLARE
jgi:sugar phosphate isomerase/epimerase